MVLRSLAFALVLSYGFIPAPALAKKPFKAKVVKPKKDKRFKDAKVTTIKPRKAAKR